MQTPYLIIDKRWLDFSEPEVMEGRRLLRYETSDYAFLFFPPDNDEQVEVFKKRVYLKGDTVRYEDGFMLKYPFGYIEFACDKLDLFKVPSIELDGFFSRICADEEAGITIDGSGTYLQTLCSYENDERIVFSNNMQLLENFLKINKVALEPNIDFFANHMFNYSLAYYASAGTPWKQIRFHDSLETIHIGETITANLSNKFELAEYTALTRDERNSLLYKRIINCLGEYCSYIGVDVIGHNLTGGRDSRASLSIFMQEVRDKIEIVTGGFHYTQDRVISHHVAKRFGFRARDTKEIESSPTYDYRSVMNKTNLAQWMIPLFREMHFTSKFDSSKMVASGFLGNVITFDGGMRNQIILDNRYHMEESAELRLRQNYDEKLGDLENVYGDRAYAMFNLMYNTTNKIASVCRRLKQNTFCIFELDIFQLCYNLESELQRQSGSLHYEIMRLSEPELLTTVPFETNKCFEGMPDTFELPGFKELSRLRPYKNFLQENLQIITEHLFENKDSLPFLSDSFYELLRSMRNKDIPPLLVNKIYAGLGALEFLGNSLADVEIHTSKRTVNQYSLEFFEGMYLEPQLWASGLPSMVYQEKVIFKTCVQFPEHVNLRVTVRDAASYKILDSETEKLADGYLTIIELPASGKYRVNFSTYDTSSKIVSQKYKTSFVAQFPDVEYEEPKKKLAA